MRVDGLENPPAADIKKSTNTGHCTRTDGYKYKCILGFHYQSRRLSREVEGTVNSMEQKTGVFCLIDVQEFHLWKRTLQLVICPSFFLDVRYIWRL
jgi:hypothetical protein